MFLGDLEKENYCHGLTQGIRLRRILFWILFNPRELQTLIPGAHESC